jgi:hypothetical protein
MLNTALSEGNEDTQMNLLTNENAIFKSTTPMEGLTKI